MNHSSEVFASLFRCSRSVICIWSVTLSLRRAVMLRLDYREWSAPAIYVSSVLSREMLNLCIDLLMCFLSQRKSSISVLIEELNSSNVIYFIIFVSRNCFCLQLPLNFAPLSVRWILLSALDDWVQRIRTVIWRKSLELLLLILFMQYIYMI